MTLFSIEVDIVLNDLPIWLKKDNNLFKSSFLILTILKIIMTPEEAQPYGQITISLV
jgi:hypothetical protein